MLSYQTGVASDETHTQTKLESILRERCEPLISVSLSSFLSSVHGLVIGVASLPSTDHGSGKLSFRRLGKDAQRCGRFGQSWMECMQTHCIEGGPFAHGSYEGLVGEGPPCPKESKYIAALYGP